LNGSTIQYVYFDVPLGTAKERNARRSGRERVPDSVIERMYWSFSKPAAHVMVIDENGKEVIKEETT
jgi:predicted kinase